MLVVGDGRGPLGEHHGNVVLDPVAAPQPGVIEQSLIGEVQEAALVNRADQNLKQRFVQGHESHLSLRRIRLALLPGRAPPRPTAPPRPAWTATPPRSPRSGCRPGDAPVAPGRREAAPAT